MALTIRWRGFEWDAAKAAFNLDKHGVDFRLAAALDLENAVSQAHIVGDETRVLSYAMADGRLYAMVWTPRGERLRVISLRKANAREVARHG